MLEDEFGRPTISTQSFDGFSTQSVSETDFPVFEVQSTSIP
jgi:hypothetical protein